MKKLVMVILDILDSVSILNSLFDILYDRYIIVKR